MKRNFNSNSFVLEIEHKHRLGLSYIEALMQYSEENEVEPESVASMLKKIEPLRQKIEAECSELNLLKSKHTPLPI